VNHAFWLAAFWGSAAWLGYLYLGYPLALWMMRRWRPSCHHLVDDDYLPALSVLIAARNEEKDIWWKVEETLHWDYPADRLQVLVASDASDDRTDEVLATIRDPRFVFVRMPRRGGKNVALEHLATLATGEILLFSDANSHIDARSVRNMVRHFADAEVGCVTGIERPPAPAGKPTSDSAGGAYLRYEAWVNQLESCLGSVLVCDGSIFCIRRDLFDGLDPELANDLEQPLKIGARGWKLLYEPEAYSVESPTASARQEFARRRRICGQGLLATWRLRSRLRGFRLWQFASRKMLRWFGLVPLAVLLASSLALFRLPLFAALALVQLFCFLLALAGWVLAAMGRRPGTLFALPYYYVLLNVAALAGAADALRGRRYGVWDVATLSRGRDAHPQVEARHA